MKRIGRTQCCAIQLQIVTAGKICAINVLMVKNCPFQELNICGLLKTMGETRSPKKICIITKDCQIGEVVERFQETFGRVKEHQNTKLIQAAEFQTDINHPKKQVLQIDYAVACQCELQNETMGALWTRGSVNLFTCTVYHNSNTKHLFLVLITKGRIRFPLASS